MHEEMEIFRIGRVVEVRERLVIAELDVHLHGPPPPFGSLVRLLTLDNMYYGLVSDAHQSLRRWSSSLRHIAPMDPDLPGDAALDRSVMKLKIVILGTLSRVNQKLVPEEGRRNVALHHALVVAANEQDVQVVAMQPEFLEVLVQLPDVLHSNELIVASLRRFANCFPDPVSFLAGACRHLSRLSRNDQARINQILKQVSYTPHASPRPR